MRYGLGMFSQLNKTTILLFALATPAFASHRVVAVIPPPKDGALAVDVEIRLGHSPDVSLISRGSQLEILRGLSLTPETPVDESLALQLGQLSGADAVIYGSSTKLRVCKIESEACHDLSIADGAALASQILTDIGATAPAPRVTPWPDEQKNRAALAAYADCRWAVSLALERTAVKGHKAKLKGLDAACKKAVTLDTSYPPAKAALAAVRALSGDATAEHDLSEALVILPTDALAPEALVNLLVEKDRAREAIDQLSAAEKLAPTSIDLRRLRAERLFRMDMFGRALPPFQEALALAPRSPYLHWRLAYTLHMQGDDAAALGHAETASRLAGGKHPFYQEEYASRLIDLGRYAEAQALLEPLYKNDPAWGRVALRLGYVMHKLGNSKGALPLFAKAAMAKPRDHREENDNVVARLDLARAHARLGETEFAYQELLELKKAGKLNMADLQDADFAGMRTEARFSGLAK